MAPNVKDVTFEVVSQNDNEMFTVRPASGASNSYAAGGSSLNLPAAANGDGNSSTGSSDRFLLSGAAAAISGLLRGRTLRQKRDELGHALSISQRGARQARGEQYRRSDRVPAPID